MTHTLVKLGPKGQILIKKEFRDKVGLTVGHYAEAVLKPQGILIRPLNPAKELEKARKLRAYLSKYWPKDVDCVEAVKEQRE